MVLKSRACGVLRLLRMHPFDCQRCSLENDCEGRYIRERLQELCRECKPTPATEASTPADQSCIHIGTELVSKSIPRNSRMSWASRTSIVFGIPSIRPDELHQQQCLLVTPHFRRGR